jgi:MoaA/NifB/PqqE/SkfB family radical SAM enzyme
MPLVCNYYLTLRCNARCTFCDCWQHPGKTLADPQTVHTNLRQLPAAGVRIVDFTGGEPLLHPELPSFLKGAKACGLLTTVTTNGLLYPRIGREIRGLVNLLHISLDGASAETHDRLRGVACYDRVLESIELALSLGEKPDLLFTAMAENYREIVPLADFARRLGLVVIVNPVFEITGGEGVLSRAQLKELAALCRRPFVYLNGGVLRLMLEGGNDPRNPRCRAVSSSVVISPDDELLLPCFHQAQRAIPIRGHLKEVLAGPERKEAIQREGREAFCRDCTINCYLAPSLPYRLDRYFASFIPWAAKYFYYRTRHQRVSSPAA